MILNELHARNRFQRPLAEFGGNGTGEFGKFHSAYDKSGGRGKDKRTELVQSSLRIVLEKGPKTDEGKEAHGRILELAWNLLIDIAGKKKFDPEFASTVVGALRQTGAEFVVETFEMLGKIITATEKRHGDVGTLFKLSAKALDEIARPALEGLIGTIQQGTDREEGEQAHKQVNALAYLVNQLPKKTQLEIVRALKIVSMETPKPAKSFLMYTGIIEQHGELLTAIDSAYAEIGLFMQKARAKDMEWLTKQAVEGDFSYHAAAVLVVTPGNEDSLEKVLRSKNTDRGAARLAVIGLTQRGLHQHVIQILRDAHADKNPNSDAIAEQLSKDISITRMQAVSTGGELRFAGEEVSLKELLSGRGVKAGASAVLGLIDALNFAAGKGRGDGHDN